jgi:Rad3-related DNA helicase
MTGRAVRNKDDHAITYIFDQQFASNLWRKNKMLFPDWWRESVITNTNIREFMS